MNCSEMAKERGINYPAPILSDGTLRFAAMTAAFFQPDMPDLITIEEIENGIHPSRLRLLLELLKTQASPDHQVCELQCPCYSRKLDL